MLIKRRKQVSHPQILGFLKRLSTIMLQIPAEKSSHVFMLLRSILQVRASDKKFKFRDFFYLMEWTFDNSIAYVDFFLNYYNKLNR